MSGRPPLLFFVFFFGFSPVCLFLGLLLFCFYLSFLFSAFVSVFLAVLCFLLVMYLLLV